MTYCYCTICALDIAWYNLSSCLKSFLNMKIIISLKEYFLGLLKDCKHFSSYKEALILGYVVADLAIL